MNDLVNLYIYFLDHTRSLMGYCFSVTKHEVVAVSGEQTAIPYDCMPTSHHASSHSVVQGPDQATNIQVANPHILFTSCC